MALSPLTRGPFPCSASRNRRDMLTPVYASLSNVAFSPDTLSNLAVWLKADALALSDNDPVSTWTDSSGNSYSPTSSSGNRPLYKTGILNGLPVVRFDGTDDFMTYTGAVISSGDAPVTVFAVCSFDDLSSYPEIFEVGNDHAGADHEDYQFLVLADGGMNSAAYGGDNDRYTAAGTVVTSTPYVLTYRWNGGGPSGSNPEFWKDGVSQAHAGGTGTTAPNINPQRYRIGANIAASRTQHLDGDIAELIVYDAGLSNGDRALVENYLIDKWGI